MEDLELNRNLEETKELHSRWSQFHDFFKMALKGSKVTPQAESKFLELKTRIAMLHDGFMHSLKHDPQIGQNVLGIIGQCIMLRRVPELSQAEVQKLEFDWNECYLLMTETIANMEEEKDDLSEVSEGAYKMSMAKERIGAAVHNFFVSPLFKLAVIVGVIGFVLIGVPALGIYDYMNIKQDLPWMAFAYDRVVPLVRMVNSELDFTVLDDVPKTDEGRDAYPFRQEGLQLITPEWLKSQFPAYGFTDALSLKEAQQLFDARKEFDREMRALPVRGSDVLYAYYILFATSEDAKRFVELRRASIAKLGPDDISRFEMTQNVCRKANFVGMFAANEEGLRVGFPEETFNFKKDEMHL